MGSKQTKIEVQLVTAALERDEGLPEVNYLDPRSPSTCRSPISASESQEKLPMAQQQSTENPLNILRRHIFKGFNYNLQDPRSPSVRLNRTPLIFEDANDKGFSLDDTFADLFVDTRNPTKVDSEKANTATDEIKHTEEMQLDGEVNPLLFEQLPAGVKTNDSLNASSFTAVEEETMPCPVKLNQTPIELQQQIDPRSPTIGLERTPIIFNDDENEDAMLENILATLSLNISNSSSLVSFNGIISPIGAQAQRSELTADNTVAPSNKHLERVRRNGSRQPLRMPTKSKLVHRHRQRVYEDRENALASIPQSSTPKKRMYIKDDGGESPRIRTPLSCVKNRPHLRSRSVEFSGESLKARLASTSFNDSLDILKHKNIKSVDMEQALCLDI